jgi:hypothetical protein
MSLLHSVNLSDGNEIFSDQVLMIQPSTFFTSSNQPSALYFFNEIISHRGRTSESSKGRVNVRIATGIAFCSLDVLSPQV